MTGRVKTSDQLKKALVLRLGGYSLASIAQNTGISPATLSRHFSKHQAKKGGLSDEAVNEARRQLLDDAGFISDLKSQIAASIVDDICQVKALREAISLTLESTMADSSLPAHYKARSIAALATSVGLTQAAIRKALSADNQPIEQEDLPNLYICELSQDEIEEIRNAQAEIEDEMGIGCEVVETTE